MEPDGLTKCGPLGHNGWLAVVGIHIGQSVPQWVISEEIKKEKVIGHINVMFVGRDSVEKVN